MYSLYCLMILLQVMYRSVDNWDDDDEDSKRKSFSLSLEEEKAQQLCPPCTRISPFPRVGGGHGPGPVRECSECMHHTLPFRKLNPEPEEQNSLKPSSKNKKPVKKYRNRGSRRQLIQSEGRERMKCNICDTRLSGPVAALGISGSVKGGN